MSREELVQFIKTGGMIQDVVDEPEEMPIGELMQVDEDVPVRVDINRLATWKAATLAAKLQDSRLSDGEKMPYLVEFAEYVLGDGLDVIIEHLGGPEQATFHGVMAYITQIVEESGQKK